MQETDGKTLSGVSGISEEYSQILSFHSYAASSQKENELDSSIEAVLTRLDEFYGMLDMIRSDSTALSDDALHKFKVERDKLQLVYQQIDDMDKFVEVVKSDCDAVEKCLELSEHEFSTVNSIKRAIAGFKVSSLWKRSSERERISDARRDFVSPVIFHTSEFLSSKGTL